MKRFFLVVPFLLALSAMANDEPGNALLELKKESAHMVFQDSTLTARERKLIADDLNLILGHFDKVDPYPAGKEIRVDLSGNEVTAEWHPGFSGGSRYAPDGFFNQFGLGYGPEGDRHLIVTEELSERYRSAFPEKPLNDKLQSFLSALRSRETLPFSIEQRLWFHSSFSEEEELKKTITETNNPFRRQWRDPSLLDIRRATGEPENKAHGHWIADIYFFDEKGELQKWWVPAIYDDEKWKMVIAIPGT